jgi:serine/threonine protein kinase
MMSAMETMVSTVGSRISEAIELGDSLHRGACAGPWVVERELGRGGMGAVYAVVHEAIGKRAALKVLHRSLLALDFNCDRMLLEAQVVNQVGHPHIVDIFETGKLVDGRPYIVMERLAGQPLSDRADEGKLLPDLVIAILLQVCDALIAAHAAGVVHRDLKLDNVFLVDNPDGPAPRVKVLDWGIAKVLSHDVKHTIEGQVVGTPRYLAPEQARGLPVSPQTDVYSLGVMAYELFVERPPFDAETAAEVMAMHVRQPPPRPRELSPNLPPELEDLLLAMLAKRGDERPTMLEVARRLEVVRENLEHRKHGAQSVPARSIGVRSLSRRSRATSGIWRSHTRPCQYVVGTFSLIIAAVLFWISHASDGVGNVALANSGDLRPISGELSPVASRESERTIAAQPSTVERKAEAPAPTAPVGEGAKPQVKLTAVPPAVRANPRRHARASASRPEPSHKPALAVYKEARIHPDGTLEPYR